MKYIYVINGPNLNLLGLREPTIYGSQTLKDIEQICTDYVKNIDYELKFLQSNGEGALIDFIQMACKDGSAIIINAAAYSHTSIAILDALQIFKGLVIEVHISNIYKREEFRHCSYCSKRAEAVISGCGPQGYLYAVDYIVKRLSLKT